MMAFLVNALLLFSNMLGVPGTPLSDSVWTIKAPWTTEEVGLTTATFSASIDRLNCGVNKSLKFPRIIQGAHQIFLDGRLIETFNDPTMKTVRSFFGRPAVDCIRLIGKELVWKIFSSTKYFAHFSYWPETMITKSSVEVFDETANIAAFGALLVLVTYLICRISTKARTKLISSLCILSLSLSVYFFMTSPGLMGVSVSMLKAHRIADFFLIVGSVTIIKYLALQSLVPRFFGYLHYSIVGIALCIILVAKDSDEIQVATSLAFITFLPALILALFAKIRNLVAKKPNFELQDVFESAGLVILVGTVFNDILCTIGVFIHQMILPLGFVAGIYLFAMTLHFKEAA